MRHTRRTVSLLVAMVAAPFSWGELPPISIEELARRMDEGEFLVHSLCVEGETRIHQKPGSSRTKPPFGLPAKRWIRFTYRMRDRGRREYYQSSEAPRATFLDGPEGPVPPKEPTYIHSYDGKVHMQYALNRVVVDYENPDHRHLDHLGLVELHLVRNGHTHTEFFAGASTAFGPTEMHDGRECYVVRHGPKGGPKPSKLWICPDLDYTVVRWCYFHPNGEIIREEVYHGYAEHGDGIWLPASHKSVMREQTTWHTYDRYSQVNEHIPLSEFRITPPKGSYVVDNRFGKGWIPHWRDLLGYGLPVVVLAIAIYRYHRMQKSRSTEN